MTQDNEFPTDPQLPPPLLPTRLTYHGELGPLFEALAKAQAEFPVLEKSRTVQVRSEKGSYSFDYATLDDLQQATRPILAKHGLCLIQPFYGDVGSKELRTILGHATGARIEATVVLTEAPSVQQFGSQLTYIKRYAIKSLLCINDGEDDDGAEASGMKADVAPRQRQASPPPVPQQAKRQVRQEPPPVKPEPPKEEPKAPPPTPPKPQVFAAPMAPPEPPKVPPTQPPPPPAPPALPPEPTDGMMAPEPVNAENTPILQATFDAIRAIATTKLRRSNPALRYLCSKHSMGRYQSGNPMAVLTEAEGAMVLGDIQSMSDATVQALLNKYPPDQRAK